VTYVFEIWTLVGIGLVAWFVLVAFFTPRLDYRIRTRPRLDSAEFLHVIACLEDLDYSGRKLDRAVIRQLTTCRWVAEHQNILITGPTSSSNRVARITLSYGSPAAVSS
jgi:hypothetical protein